MKTFLVPSLHLYATMKEAVWLQKRAKCIVAPCGEFMAYVYQIRNSRRARKICRRVVR